MAIPAAAILLTVSHGGPGCIYQMSVVCPRRGGRGFSRAFPGCVFPGRAVFWEGLLARGPPGRGRGGAGSGTGWGRVAALSGENPSGLSRHICRAGNLKPGG